MSDETTPTFRDAMAPALVAIDPGAAVRHDLPRLDERTTVTLPADRAWTIAQRPDGGLTLTSGALPAALDVGTADAVTFGAARVIAEDYAAGLARERDEARRELQDLDLVLPVACGSRADAAMQMQADLARAEGQLAALAGALQSVELVGVVRPEDEARLEGIIAPLDSRRDGAALAATAEAHDRRVAARALREAADAWADAASVNNAEWVGVPERWLRARADEIERG